MLYIPLAAGFLDVVGATVGGVGATVGVEEPVE